MTLTASCLGAATGRGTGNGEEENGDWGAGAAAGTNKRAWLPISSSFFSSIPSLTTDMGPTWKATYLMQGKANPWRWKADLGKVREEVCKKYRYVPQVQDSTCITVLTTLRIVRRRANAA